MALAGEANFNSEGGLRTVLSGRLQAPHAALTAPKLFSASRLTCLQYFAHVFLSFDFNSNNMRDIISSQRR